MCLHHVLTYYDTTSTTKRTRTFCQFCFPGTCHPLSHKNVTQNTVINKLECYIIEVDIIENTHGKCACKNETNTCYEEIHYG
jgi:hypothetical protein